MARHDGKHVTLKFSVNYNTVWGEYLVLSGDRGLLGEWDVHRGIQMTCTEGADGCTWEASIDVPDNYDFMYTYVVATDGNHVVHKELYPHALTLPGATNPKGVVIQIIDTFQVCLLLQTYLSTYVRHLPCSSSVTMPFGCITCMPACRLMKYPSISQLIVWLTTVCACIYNEHLKISFAFNF